MTERRRLSASITPSRRSDRTRSWNIAAVRTSASIGARSRPDRSNTSARTSARKAGSVAGATASGNEKSTLRRTACPRAATSDRNGGARTKHQSAPALPAPSIASRQTADGLVAQWSCSSATAVPRRVVSVACTESRSNTAFDARKSQRGEQRHRGDVEEGSRSGRGSARCRDALPPANQLRLVAPDAPVAHRAGVEQESIRDNNGVGRGGRPHRSTDGSSSRRQTHQLEDRRADLDCAIGLGASDPIVEIARDDLAYACRTLFGVQRPAVEQAHLQIDPAESDRPARPRWRVPARASGRFRGPAADVNAAPSAPPRWPRRASQVESARIAQDGCGRPDQHETAFEHRARSIHEGHGKKQQARVTGEWAECGHSIQPARAETARMWWGTPVGREDSSLPQAAGRGLGLSRPGPT